MVIDTLAFGVSDITSVCFESDKKLPGGGGWPIGTY